MSDLRPRGEPVVLDGQERRFLFTLNVVNELQDKYEKSIHGIITDLINEEAPGNMLRDLVVVLLNDEAEREERKGRETQGRVTEREVGEMIGMDNYWEVMTALLKAYGLSMPKAEDDYPNPEGGQTSS